MAGRKIQFSCTRLPYFKGEAFYFIRKGSRSGFRWYGKQKGLNPPLEPLVTDLPAEPAEGPSGLGSQGPKEPCFLESEENWDELGRRFTFKRAAAVMFLFFEDSETNELWVVLTRRAVHLSTHKGQISFAGGRRDPLDEFPSDTARRETFEEIGINQADIEVLGSLHPLHSIDDTFLVPVVGIYRGLRAQFQPDPREIKDIIFLGPSEVYESMSRPFEFILYGETRRTPYFYCSGAHVWGLTAEIIEKAGLSDRV